MAVKSGEILEAGYSNSYGYYVKYRTYDKYDVLYAHLNSIKVKKGENITQGDVVAYSGNTGDSTGPHLHYEIKQGNEYINPENYYRINGFREKSLLKKLLVFPLTHFYFIIVF